jgi:hypothetical protein
MKSKFQSFIALAERGLAPIGTGSAFGKSRLLDLDVAESAGRSLDAEQFDLFAAAGYAANRIHSEPLVD